MGYQSLDTRMNAKGAFEDVRAPRVEVQADRIKQEGGMIVSTLTGRYFDPQTTSIVRPAAPAPSVNL